MWGHIFKGVHISKREEENLNLKFDCWGKKFEDACHKVWRRQAYPFLVKSEHVFAIFFSRLLSGIGARKGIAPLNTSNCTDFRRQNRLEACQSENHILNALFSSYFCTKDVAWTPKQLSARYWVKNFVWKKKERLLQILISSVSLYARIIAISFIMKISCWKIKPK